MSNEGMREIERKFLLDVNLINPEYIRDKKELSQGYIAESDDFVVRVRLSAKSYEKEAFLTIKSRNGGMSRYEYEQNISMGDAEIMLKPIKQKITKTRMYYAFEGYLFEMDIFKDRLSGLNVVEVEFETEKDANAFKPDNFPFLGAELTDDYRFSNHYLAVDTDFDFKTVIEGL